jgi:uncharacterized membrane protein
VRWLFAELPGLVRDGVVSAGAAERIREHYGEAGRARSVQRIAVTVCAVLGAALIGSGVILLLAYNWQDLSRPVRAVLSLAPLVVAQVLAAWSVRTGRSSAAWREGTTVAVVFAVGASIALIGQTYHIPGDMGRFLLTWALLALPLVYTLDASVPLVLYLCGITAWAGYEQSRAGHALLFWPLFALALPHVVRHVRRDPCAYRSAGLCWAVALCLCVATGISLEKALPGLWIVVYAAMFAVLFLAGIRWFGAGANTAQRPFQTVGAVGGAVLALLLTWEFGWESIGWHHYRWGVRFHEAAAVADYVLAALLTTAAAGLLAGAARRSEPLGLLFGALPAAAMAGYGLTVFGEAEMPAMLLFNAYVLVLGAGTLAVGVRTERLGTVNGGLLILGALLVMRFFDQELGFVARGVAFIVVGAGFLGVNLLLAKRWRRAGP